MHTRRVLHLQERQLDILYSSVTKQILLNTTFMSEAPEASQLLGIFWFHGTSGGLLPVDASHGQPLTLAKRMLRYKLAGFNERKS